MQRTHLYPAFQALLAALLFGASAPIAKLLLGQVEPIFLAGFLYLGSGLGVILFKLAQGTRATGHDQEARLARADVRWLVGAVVAGGILAPILLLFSLRVTPAFTASLLLNFESVATALIATVVFKEALSRRALGAILGVTLASILLSWNTTGEWGFSLGALGVVGACVLWGVDNNFTRNISAKDPLIIVLVKGLGAGTFSVLLAFALGNAVPSVSVVLGSLVVGSLCYGLSIVLFIRAMRGLGAARTSALFGTAPLMGVVLSFIILRELPGTLFWLALPLMAGATVLLLNEQHRHEHIHDALSHDHRLRHDDGHHMHMHPGMEDHSLSHSHPHAHEHLEHDHPHLPDIHHRHVHAAE